MADKPHDIGMALVKVINFPAKGFAVRCLCRQRAQQKKYGQKCL
jgi:hypothetical protein